MSTSYHPQSDGQTERVNQVLEQYLRLYCNYQQNDWYSLLCLAEFTYNNSIHSSTNTSPFFANYGYHPRFNLKIINQEINPAAETYIDVVRRLHIAMQEEIKSAQEAYKKFYDRARIETPPYEIGQKVWLIRKNIATNRPSLKLDSKKIGPFKILNFVGESNLAVKLDLPPSMKLHPVFHVSLLEPYYASNIPGRSQTPPPPIEVDGQDEWVVKEVLDSRVQRNKLQYFVEWEGYGEADRTWEPSENLENCPDLVNDYHLKYPDKSSSQDIRPRRARP
jgi:hypothetical protein